MFDFKTILKVLRCRSVFKGRGSGVPTNGKILNMANAFAEVKSDKNKHGTPMYM